MQNDLRILVALSTRLYPESMCHPPSFDAFEGVTVVLQMDEIMVATHTPTLGNLGLPALPASSTKAATLPICFHSGSLPHNRDVQPTVETPVVMRIAAAQNDLVV